MSSSNCWTVAELIGPVERAYPPETAESWDQVGLAVGDLDTTVDSVLLTVDVTDAVLAEAISRGASLIISHHPLLLHGINAVRTDQPKGRLIATLIRHGIALYTTHTNADIAVDGTAATLAARLGLIEPRPLINIAIPPLDGHPLDKITVFVPDDHAAMLREAMSEAGGGAIGDYDRCAFSVAGAGTFRPLPGAHPFLGTVGEIEQVAETRIEMIMERRRRQSVRAALLAAHPYETPAYDIVEVAELDADPGLRTGLGRVGDVPPCTLAEFAALVADRVACGVGGVLVAGELERQVRRVAVQAGAGDDLFEQARASGADVYLTSDLRHHRASEALAWADAPALIDIPHAAAESLWLPRLAEIVTTVGAEDPQGRVPPAVFVSEVATDPWNHRL